MIRLVVNAEEFGRTTDDDGRARDQATMRAHRAGIVTSAALAGNCADLAAARDALLAAPALGVGLALALIEGVPVAPPQQVRTLLGAAGVLRTSAREFAVEWLKSAIAPGDVEREMDAQVTRALESGLELDHLSTRGHLGFLPGVGQLVEAVARRHRIPGIRSSVEPPTLGWVTDPRRGMEVGLLAGLSWLTRKRMGPLRHGPRTWGYVESERLDEVRIIETIGRMGPGSHELLCHPAAPGEERALTSAKVKTALQGRGILLCRWRELF